MLNIVYAGSPDIAAVVLKELIDSGRVRIVAVLTNAPAAKGRHKTPVATPVADVARGAGLCVIEPEKLTEDVRNQIVGLNPDILVCFAYGKIFGPKFMALFPLGGINLHTSLLPKYRGSAPVPAAILAGENETGATVQRLAPKMDTGDILLQHKILLDGTETSEDVLQKLTWMGADMFFEVLMAIEEGSDCGIVQNEKDASYCDLLKKEDGLIDWTKGAVQICAQVRALYPWPGAFTCASGTALSIQRAQVFPNKDVFCVREGSVVGSSLPGTVLGVDKKYGILVQTGQGILAVQQLRKEGKKTMHWKDFINGTQNFAGTYCTNPVKSS